jgi:hypothetical protein
VTDGSRRDVFCTFIELIGTPLPFSSERLGGVYEGARVVGVAMVTHRPPHIVVQLPRVCGRSLRDLIHSNTFPRLGLPGGRYFICVSLIPFSPQRQ